MKNKIVITSLSILLIGIIVGIGVFIKSEVNKKAIAEEIKNQTEIINKEYARFEELEDRDKKLAVITSLTDKYDQYLKTEKPQDEVVSKFGDRIGKMKLHFVKDYEKLIADGTIDDVSKVDDKKKVAKVKDSLVKSLEIIEKEKDVTLDENQFAEFKDEIESLIRSYESRIDAIKLAEKKAEEERIAKEKAEKERKEREIAEAKAKAEAEAEAQRQREIAEANKQKSKAASSAPASGGQQGGSASSGSSKSSSQNSSGGTSGNKSTSPKSNNSGSNSSSGGEKRVWLIDKDGNKIDGTGGTISDGKFTPDEGGEVFDMDEWFDKFE